MITTRGRVVALGVLLAAAGCGGSTSAGSGATPPAQSGPRAVRIVTAQLETLARTITVPGTLAAEDQVTLSFKVTGRLEQLAVDLGSRVARGDVVARLAPTDFALRIRQADAALQQARARLGLSPDGQDDRVDPEQTAVVRQARAVLDQARLTRQRAEAFVRDGIAARADLDEADAAFKVAEGRLQDAIEEVRNRQAVLVQRRTELELAKQALTDSALTAPLDGMVRERHTAAGQYLAVGTPVVTLVRIDPLRLRVAVPEREAALVRAGQAVRVRVEGDPTSHPGRVVRVSPVIDETSRTLMVEAEVANHRGALRPGSFANADIETSSRESAILVPASAIVTFAGVDKVFVVSGGKAAETRVTLGRREAGRVEVTQGLNAGQDVVVEPGNLVNGESVKVTPGPPPPSPGAGRLPAR